MKTASAQAMTARKNLLKFVSVACSRLAVDLYVYAA